MLAAVLPVLLVLGLELLNVPIFEVDYVEGDVEYLRRSRYEHIFRLPALFAQDLL